MSSASEGKLKLLQRSLASEGVVTQQWLSKQGIYQQLTQKYVESKWIDRIGHGAFKRHGDTITWESALNAVQKQQAISLHVGARTAIEIKGGAHYLKGGKKGTVFLFGHQGTSGLPKWFLKQDWEKTFEVIKTNLFPQNYKFCCSEEEVNGHEISVSSKERAALEMLYLIPKKQTWEEAELIFENLVSLRPKQVQSLLENCSSIKVKRLFLFFAEKYSYQWFGKLNIKKINLGSGDRVIFKNGVFDKKYRITLPPDLFKEEQEGG